MKIMKSLLIKTYKDGGDPYEAILKQRNTPRQDTALSPAQMIFNGNTRSFLPSLSSNPKNTLVKGKRELSAKTQRENISRSEIKQTLSY